MKYLRLYSVLFLAAFCAYAVYPPLETRIIRPWELPLYTNVNGMAKFIITFPPFELSPRTIADGSAPKTLWQYAAEPIGGGPLITGNLFIPQSWSGDTLFSDIMHTRYLPRTPFSKILFTHSLTVPPDITNGLTLCTPTQWTESESFINGRSVSIITGYHVRAHGLLREITVPQAVLRDDGCNSVSTILYPSNHQSDLASYYQAGEVILTHMVSNISPYADMVDVLYRRNDLYGFQLYRSALHPFPLMETVWKSVYISGYSNDGIALTRAGFFIASNRYVSRPLSGEVFSLRTNKLLSRNWFILFGGNDGTRDYPLLVVYNLPLIAFTVLDDDIFRLDFPYEMMYTYVAVVPLSDAADGIPLTRSRSLNDSIDASLAAKCDEIARIAFSMPVRIRGDAAKIPASFSYDAHESLFADRARQAPLPPGAQFPKSIPFNARRTLVFAGGTWRYVR